MTCTRHLRVQCVSMLHTNFLNWIADLHMSHKYVPKRIINGTSLKNKCIGEKFICQSLAKVNSLVSHCWEENEFTKLFPLVNYVSNIFSRFPPLVFLKGYIYAIAYKVDELTTNWDLWYRYLHTYAEVSYLFASFRDIWDLRLINDHLFLACSQYFLLVRKIKTLIKSSFCAYKVRN